MSEREQTICCQACGKAYDGDEHKSYWVKVCWFDHECKEQCSMHFCWKDECQNKARSMRICSAYYMSRLPL